MQGALRSTPSSKTKRAIVVTMTMGRSLNWQSTRLLTGGMRVRLPYVPPHDSRLVA